MNNIDAYHSPERMGAMLIINAPTIVYTFYSMISYLLDDRTANKIRIFASEEQWRPELLKLVDPSQLPPEYGGTGTSKGMDEQEVDGRRRRNRDHRRGHRRARRRSTMPSLRAYSRTPSANTSAWTTPSWTLSSWCDRALDRDRNTDNDTCKDRERDRERDRDRGWA